MSKPIWVLLTSIIMMATFTTACAGKWNTPIPDTDIVYQEGSIEHPSIGFVDANGRNNSSIQTSTYLIKPFWSIDGKTIYALARRASVLDGYLSLWQEGRRLKTCKEWWDTETIGGIIDKEDSTLALISVRDQILLVDLKRCEELTVFLDYVNTGVFISGLSLSPDQTRFVYGESRNYNSDTKTPEHSIMIREMSGDEPIDIGSGINPVWSPDGKQISYLQLNGIFVMNSDGSNPRLVTKLDTSSGENDGKFDSLAPYPRWSPDGKWLIFHRCHPECAIIDEYKIIKVEIATGKEEIVANGGAYPYWR